MPQVADQNWAQCPHIHSWVQAFTFSCAPTFSHRLFFILLKRSKGQCCRLGTALLVARWWRLTIAHKGEAKGADAGVVPHRVK